MRASLAFQFENLKSKTSHFLGAFPFSPKLSDRVLFDHFKFEFQTGTSSVSYTNFRGLLFNVVLLAGLGLAVGLDMFVKKKINKKLIKIFDKKLRLSFSIKKNSYANQFVVEPSRVLESTKASSRIWSSLL